MPIVESGLALMGEAGQVGNASAEVIQAVQKMEQEIIKQVTQEVAKTMWRTTKKPKHAKKHARYVIEGRTGKPTESRTLQKKMDDVLRDAKQARTKERSLSDGRNRYYGKEELSDTPGPTRGRSRVVEHNPKTGQVWIWMECYDYNGNVNRIHPKMINGIEVNAQHYPATYADKLNNVKGMKWLTRDKSLL